MRETLAPLHRQPVNCKPRRVDGMSGAAGLDLPHLIPLAALTVGRIMPVNPVMQAAMQVAQDVLRRAAEMVETVYAGISRKRFQGAPRFDVGAESAPLAVGESDNALHRSLAIIYLTDER